MKKRLIALVSAGILAAGMFAGCGAKEDTPAEQSTVKSESNETTDGSNEEAKAESEAPADETDGSEESGLRGEGKKVTALFFSLEGEFFNIFNSNLEAGLTELGYEYESQSSNMDSITMIEQIENATAKGSDLIWVWATNAAEVADACKKARENGVLIYAFVSDPGEDARDMFRGTDEDYNGKVMAELCMEWADRDMPDAGEGEIRTLLIRSDDLSSTKERGDAAKKYLLEDPRFTIVEEIDCEQSVVAAQETTENMFAKHGDNIDCILSLAPGLGVLAYLDSEACIAEDPVSKGVISSEVNEELADYMRRGLYDGTAVNGGNPVENAATQVTEMDQLIHGESEGGFSGVDIAKVTVDNLEEFGY